MKRNQLLLFLVLTCWMLNASAQRYELNKKDTSEVQWIKGSKYYVYKVEKSETIYSITRRFGISEEELLKNNPDLKNGLKNKMSLLIPAQSALKKNADQKVEEKKPAKREVNIGLMLPVNIWKSMIPDSAYEDSDHHEMYAETISQLEFYEGALHAADSIASRDMRIHLSIYDTENDTARTAALLKERGVKDLQYIISTSGPQVLRLLNQFSMTNKTSLVTPSLNSSDIMKGNANAYAMQPSSVTQCYEAGKMCSQKFKGSNAVVIKSGTSKETDRAIAFINGWNDNSALKCRNIDYSKGEFSFLLASLVKGTNNVLFVPSSNEDFVNNIVTKLNDTTDVYKITMIGIPTWQYFGSIDPAVLENLHTHLFSASHLDIDAPPSITFRKFFRNEYMIDPSETAYQGFDAVMLIVKTLLDKPADGAIPEFHGLYSSCRFRNPNSVNENQFIHMMRYEGYKIVEDN